MRYRIQVVSQMTGVPSATLRAWERRYGFPQPNRSDSSYRLYSDTDVSSIKRLKQMCEEGISPSEAVRLLKQEKQASKNLEVISNQKRLQSNLYPGP